MCILQVGAKPSRNPFHLWGSFHLSLYLKRNHKQSENTLGLYAYLRCQPSRVIGQQGCDRSFVRPCLDHPAQVEVRDFDAPMAVDHHVGRLEVSVQDWRLVRVQLQDSLHVQSNSA